jgi:hypothetical protein
MINIDDLTYRQLKEISEIFNNKNSEKQTQDMFLGKYVLCRCYSAGVHSGELVSQNGDVVVLKNSRRLWTWKAKNGIALSGVAQTGLKQDCKIDIVNPLIKLTGVIETILCSKEAEESINDYK